MSKIIAHSIGQRRGLRADAGWPGASAVPDMRGGAENDFCLAPTGCAADFYDRALALTGVGVWQCDLRTEALTWTAGVFDIFGIPRHSKVDRRDIVEMYSEESREAMERLRADAIAQRRGFSLDARIVRADGALRWMRLTASTAASPGRPMQLYGVKQDITEERERWEAMRRMAEQDALTGLASDLTPLFHPAATRISVVDTLFGAGGATGQRAELSGCAARWPVAVSLAA